MINKKETAEGKALRAFSFYGDDNCIFLIFCAKYQTHWNPEDSKLADSGSYKDLSEYLCSILLEKSDHQDFAAFIRKEHIITALEEHNDMRYECHILRNGSIEWEHVNIICLKRK